MAKLVYRPFGLMFSVLGGILAGVIFKQLWKLASGQEEPPKARERVSTAGKRFSPLPCWKGHFSDS